jgi:hypothetical protein
MRPSSTLADRADAAPGHKEDTRMHGRTIGVGLSADGMPDEITAETSNVHIERMDERSWWMKIEQDNCRLVLRFDGVEDVTVERDCGELP